MNIRQMNDLDAFHYISGVLDIMIEQQEDEFLWAMNCIRLHIGDVGVILEIGSGQGGTLCMLSRLIRPGGYIISIEPEKSTPIDMDRIRDIVAPVIVHHIGMVSQHVDCITEVQRLCDGSHVDLIHIDGDHAYESTSADWRNYHHMVQDPGIVLIHDLIGGQGGPTRMYPELMADGYSGATKCLDAVRYGTGIIFK